MPTAFQRIPEFKPAEYDRRKIIITGAGPTGLFLAYKLVRSGVPVLVLEAEQEIAKSPRAIVYMPIVLNEFSKVDLLEPLREISAVNNDGFIFRTPAADGDRILAELKTLLIPKGESKFNCVGLHTGQDRLAELILSKARNYTGFEIRFGERVQGVENEEDGTVTVVTTTKKGEKFYRADYVVGADGAGSIVRKSMGIPFEGFTWGDFRFVATNVHYPFAEYGYGPINMIVHENDWAVIARTSDEKENMWRIAYGVPADTPEEEIKNTIHPKFERLLPGPRPLPEYNLVSYSPYWAHQRCAKTYKKGHVLLCGDAAHSNNPVGGLGLTTGLLDGAALANCLIRIVGKNEPGGEELLEKYATIRRDAWMDYTCPTSIENKLRLHGQDKESVKAREAFFGALNNDPAFGIAFAKQMNEVLIENFEN